MDIPIVDMILRSGLAARIILILLLLLSIASWAIVFNRFFFFSDMTKGNKKFRARFDGTAGLGGLEQLSNRETAGIPLAQLAKKGAEEYGRILADAKTVPPAKDLPFFIQNRFSMASEQLQSASSAIAGTLDRGVYLLAVVSSIAPFLGLLGTVWGIMNSFYQIGTQGSASLPVVAPGIAEALVVTLMGLVVAIPALFFYNYFSHRMDRLEAELDQFREVVLVRIKRDVLAAVYSSNRGGM